MSECFDEAGADKQKSAVACHEDKHGSFKDGVIGKTLTPKAGHVEEKKTFTRTHGRGG